MTRKQYQEGLADRLRQESQSSVLFSLLSGSYPLTGQEFEATQPGPSAEDLNILESLAWRQPDPEAL